MKEIFLSFLFLITLFFVNQMSLYGSNIKSENEDIFETSKAIFIKLTSDDVLINQDNQIIIKEKIFFYLLEDKKKLKSSKIKKSFTTLCLACTVPVSLGSWDAQDIDNDSTAGYIWNLIDVNGNIFRLFTTNFYQSNKN